MGGDLSLATDAFLTVLKSGIVDTVLNWAKFKADQQLKKTDGNRRTRCVSLHVLSGLLT